jgi:hypothetical protein
VQESLVHLITNIIALVHIMDLYGDMEAKEVTTTIMVVVEQQEE